MPNATAHQQAMQKLAYRRHNTCTDTDVFRQCTLYHVRSPKATKPPLNSRRMLRPQQWHEHVFPHCIACQKRRYQRLHWIHTMAMSQVRAFFTGFGTTGGVLSPYIAATKSLSTTVVTTPVGIGRRANHDNVLLFQSKDLTHQFRLIADTWVVEATSPSQTIEPDASAQHFRTVRKTIVSIRKLDTTFQI